MTEPRLRIPGFNECAWCHAMDPHRLHLVPGFVLCHPCYQKWLKGERVPEQRVLGL